jgi:hypothetical protein
VTVAWDPVFSVANPLLLPKVRSEALRDSIRHMPCALRIASLWPGGRCAPQATVVGAHMPGIGKGNASKVSDLFIVAACQTCHDMLDGRDRHGFWVAEHYPAAFAERLIRGHQETMSRWLGAGLIVVPDGEIVR